MLHHPPDGLARALRMAHRAWDRQRGRMFVSFDVVKLPLPAKACSMRRGTRGAVLCALALISGACGTRTSYPGQDPFSGGGTAQDVRVSVRNSNFYDATLTAISDTGRRRLGTVGGNQSAVFTMPWGFTSGLRFEIDLLAGPTCTTDLITVSPGEEVVLEIMSDFSSMPFCR
jgi:hypothetical protein